ncbi:hypothetical protein [Catenovulum sediminis]|uniref:hypothetical protein n=1 Tax=Catenovulum sediminis TaxID=1740262 RepID=UPI001180EF14|nr:hypothetical protein [Catenovulum sediminis]
MKKNIFKLVVYCLIGSCLSAQANQVIQAGVYFSQQHFSKSQLLYTQTLLQPEIEILPFYPEMSETLPILISGFDNAQHYLKHFKNNRANSVLVMGVDIHQVKKLQMLVCAEPLNVCDKWRFINNQASPQRIHQLIKHFFADKKVTSAYLDQSVAEVWKPELSNVVWYQNNAENLKPFYVIKRALEGADAFVILPDENLFNASIGRVVLQYMFQNKTISIGYSAGTFQAGSAIASYADYPNTLLAVKYLLLNPDKAKNYQYACYQDYYVNQTVLDAMQLSIDTSALNQLAEQLNLQCYTE